MKFHNLNLQEGLPLSKQVSRGCYQLGIGKLQTFACSQTANFLASTDGKMIYVWHLSTGNLVSKIGRHEFDIIKIRFSWDEEKIASLDRNNMLKIWDIGTGELQTTLMSNAEIDKFSFSADSKIIAVSTKNRIITLRESETGKIARQFDGCGADFSPDGRLLAFYMDRIVYITSTEDSTVQETYHPCSKDCRVDDLSFVARSNKLAVNITCTTLDFDDVYYEEFHTLSIVNLRTLTEARFDVEKAIVSPDGKMIANLTDNKAIELWDTKNNNMVNVLTKFEAKTVDFAFEPKIIVLSENDNSIKLVDTETGNILKTLDGHVDKVFAVSFLPKERSIIASGGFDGTIRFWDFKDCRIIKSFKEDDIPIYFIAFSANGKYFACALASGIVRLHDAKTGASIISSSKVKGRILHLKFSPDSNFIFIKTKEGVALWEIGSQELWENPFGREFTGPFFNFSLSANLLGIALNKKKAIDIWNWKEKKRQTTIFLPAVKQRVVVMAFSPNESLLAVGWEDNMISIWDVKKKAFLYSLKGHESWLHSLIFSPDSKLLASDSEDQTIRLWDIETTDLLKTIPAYTSYSLSFSPDGNFIASALGDILIWDITEDRRKSYDTRSILYDEVLAEESSFPDEEFAMEEFI